MKPHTCRSLGKPCRFSWPGVTDVDGYRLLALADYPFLSSLVIIFVHISSCLSLYEVRSPGNTLDITVNHLSYLGAYSL